METALYSQHQQAGAKLVDFSGWEMPLHYGSQIEEHRQVRDSAGIFDVSHMGVVDFFGNNTESFLRHLLANDVQRLQDKQALYSCILNPAGGVIDDCIVYKFNNTHYRMIINAGRRTADIDWMRSQLDNVADVKLDVRADLCILAIQGPKALELSTPLLHKDILRLKPFHCCQFQHTTVARTGYTGESGIEVMLPADEAVSLWQRCLAAGIKPCGLGARDTLRLEAGYNLYGHDMDEDTSPVISGLSWTISTKDPERDFIGKQAYLKHKDSLKERMLGVLMTEPGVLRNHQAIQTEQGVGGIITSGGFSPTLGHAIGFARLTEDAINQPLFIERRGKQIPLHTIKLPFIKQGKKNF